MALLFGSSSNAARLLAAVGVASCHSRAEPQLVLGRRDKCADHAEIVVRFAVIDDIEPKVIPVLIHVAAQVAEVLHQHKSRVVLTRLLELAVPRVGGIGSVLEVSNFDHVAQD